MDTVSTANRFLMTRYLTKSEVADMMGYKCVKSVERNYPKWIARYRVRVSRTLSGRLRFNKNDLEQMMDALRIDHAELRHDYGRTGRPPTISTEVKEMSDA